MLNLIITINHFNPISNPISNLIFNPIFNPIFNQYLILYYKFPINYSLI